MTSPMARLGGRVLAPVAFVVVTFAAGAVVAKVVGSLPDEFASGARYAVLLRAMLLFWALAGLLVWRSRRLPLSAKAPAVAAIIGLASLSLLALALHGTAYSLNGYAGDQGYFTKLVTGFATTWKLRDPEYAGLTPSYTPLYFYALGRAAAVFGRPPFSMLKIGSFGLALATPLVYYRLWRLLLPAASALGLAFAALYFPEWYRPSSAFSMIIFLPWWLVYVLEVDLPAAEREARRFRWPRIAAGSVVGAIALLIYDYWIFIGGAHLLLLGGMWLYRRRQQRGDDEDLVPTWSRNGVAVLAGAAALSSMYWLPLVFNLVGGHWQETHNRWFVAEYAPAYLGFLTANPAGVLQLWGIAYLALRWQKDRLATALGTLLITSYAWFGLGWLLILVDKPLATFRVAEFARFLMVVSGILGLLWVVAEWRRTGSYRRFRPLAAALVAVLLLAVGESVADGIEKDDKVTQARNADASSQLAAFAAAYHGPERGRVLLSDNSAVITHLPFFLFNTWDEHNSHPAAEFASRVALLKQVEKLSDPLLVAVALRHNRYDPVDVVYLQDALTYSYALDAFPDGLKFDGVKFFPGQFSPEYFERAQGAGNTMYAYRPGARDPLAALRVCLARGCVDPASLRALRPHLDKAALAALG